MEFKEDDEAAEGKVSFALFSNLQTAQLYPCASKFLRFDYLKTTLFMHFLPLTSHFGRNRTIKGWIDRVNKINLARQKQPTNEKNSTLMDAGIGIAGAFAG